MKRLLSLFFAITLISCSVTTSIVELQPQTGEIQIKGTKEEIYIKAHLWAISKFNNAESVIQFADKEEGIIGGKYVLETIYGNSVHYGYFSTQGSTTYRYATITIYVKDGSAKIVITPNNYTISSLESQKYADMDARKEKERVEKIITSLIVDFEQNLQGMKSSF